MNRLLAASFAAVCLVTFSLPSEAKSTGSGYFRMGDNKQEYKHAVALARESASEAGKRKIHLYLTTHPVDPAQAAGGFDIDDGITSQLREVGGGMTRVTINPDGSDGGMWFWVSEPSDTFNTSGFGKLTLTTNTATRLEGSHVLAEPEDFFDKTYQFDLKFAVDVTPADFTGEALPAGGGEAGKAYLDYVAALAKGDAAALRSMMGESARWMLPEGDEASVKSSLESLRYSTLASATVSGGWQQGDRAILKVEGKDGDGNTQRGVIEMVKEDGRWKEGSKDMTTIW